MLRTKAQLKNVELELKPNSEKKVENIFVAPPYCQTECCAMPLSVVMLKQNSLRIVALDYLKITVEHIYSGTSLP